MAARLTFLVAVVSLVVLCSCAPSSSGQAGGQPTAPRNTPQASLSFQMAGTVALVRAALEARGIRLDLPVFPYQPAEPGAVASVPKVVMQADVGESGAGYAVIYEFRDAPSAAAAGAEFATYLESGFGQTNYPLDAQFSLAQVGGTVVFTWWSAALAADRERARTAFDAIAAVGQSIPIVK